jgi:hypothetical protein
VMRHDGRLAAMVAFVLTVSLPASAQQVSIDLDQPCMAAFSVLGYPQFNRLVPSESPAAARSKIRGVVARSLLWRPGETLKVCFRSGTQKARVRVARLASEWMQHANLVLDFGDVDNPRMCQGDNHESIKIDFVNTGAKSGYWSAIGTMSRKSDHSLNLSFLGEDEMPRNRAGQQMPEAEARRLVLHEFGHALGLFHEHQSPKAGCGAEYYEEAVFAFGALRGWPPEQSIQNFRQIADTPEFNATEVDRKSIMHYSLPPWLFKGGEKSPCVVQTNFELSDRDKDFVKKVYPRISESQIVATAPTTSTTRASKISAQAKLVEEYRRALQEAGVEQGKVDSMTKEFSSSMAGR